jgi:hypothetical protein
MLQTFPLILQKLYRTRNESFIKSQNQFGGKSFINKKSKRHESISKMIPSNLARYSIRGSYHHIPEVKLAKGPTISLKRLSNKKLLQENIDRLGYRDSDFMFQKYLNQDSDEDSDYSMDPLIEHEEEVRLLRTMLGFVIRRYKEHTEIKNIILCFESMRQIFSFCPKKIFHLVGLETIIDLLYNHLNKNSDWVDPDKKVI